MRLTAWQLVHSAFTLACIGPGGSGLPEALGACALARVTTANRKIAGKIRSIKQGSPDSVLSSQFSVPSSQFSVLSSQFSVLRIGWPVVPGCYYFSVLHCQVDT